MSSASMTFGRPTRLALPHGTHVFSSLTGALIRILRSIDRWSLAHQRHDEPRNAEEVLEWARRIEATEPGFAADLRSAALRSMDEPQR